VIKPDRGGRSDVDGDVRYGKVRFAVLEVRGLTGQQKPGTRFGELGFSLSRSSGVRDAYVGKEGL
jgi:hypothetical protein